jgi:hypothetical protein
MAKNVKLPRKLREKLAEIAAKRDARAAEVDDDDVDFSTTFYHAFHGKGSVFGMYASIDEVLQRMTMRIILEPPLRPKRIFVPPPWEGTARDVSD